MSPLRSRPLLLLLGAACIVLSLAGFSLRSPAGTWVRLPAGWGGSSSASPSKSNIAPVPQPEWPHEADGFIGAIIAAAREKSETAWIASLRNESWLPHVYNVDAPYEGENTLTVVRNKGHEAMVYLTYIIDHYEALPPYALFLHGHQHSWHQEADIDALVRNLRLDAVDTRGYVSLRCDWYPSCPAELRLLQHDAHVWGPGVHREDAEVAISDSAWQTFFPTTPMPATVASQCCAQFVVTRTAIRRHARADYVRMREWLLDTDLIDDVSGRVFEKLWAYIMTGRDVNCPSPHTCACEFFGMCDKKKWPEPPTALGPLPEDSQWLQ